MNSILHVGPVSKAALKDFIIRNHAQAQALWKKSNYSGDYNRFNGFLEFAVGIVETRGAFNIRPEMSTTKKAVSWQPSDDRHADIEQRDSELAEIAKKNGGVLDVCRYSWYTPAGSGWEGSRLMLQKDGTWLAIDETHPRNFATVAVYLSTWYSSYRAVGRVFDLLQGKHRSRPRTGPASDMAEAA